MMQTITIDFDDDVLRATGMSDREFAAALKFNTAARLYEDGKLTVGQSARLCEMDIAGFFNELPRHGYSLDNVGAEY